GIFYHRFSLYYPALHHVPYLQHARVPFSTAVFDSQYTAPSDTSTLPLHDALPICQQASARSCPSSSTACKSLWSASRRTAVSSGDRKSTRLNSSHGSISYAVFCLKKKIVGSKRRDRRYEAGYRASGRDVTGSGLGE